VLPILPCLYLVQWLAWESGTGSGEWMLRHGGTKRERAGEASVWVLVWVVSGVEGEG